MQSATGTFETHLTHRAWGMTTRFGHLAAPNRMIYGANPSCRHQSIVSTSKKNSDAGNAILFRVALSCDINNDSFYRFIAIAAPRLALWSHL